MAGVLSRFPPFAFLLLYVMNYKLAIAGLMVTVAMYVQLPLLPTMLLYAAPSYTAVQAAAVAAMPGVGVFALGCFSSYLVQHYRRNMVCIVALLALAVLSYLLFYLTGNVATLSGSMLRSSAYFGSGTGLFILLAVRFAQGAVFGLAQMVLSSTLVIDTCESPRRTAANQAAAWFARFALALAPMAAVALLMYREHIIDALGWDAGGWGYAAVAFAFRAALLASALLCVVSAALVMAVRFPFKAPEEIVPHVSTDRFFLSQGKWLFINLVFLVAAVGALLYADMTVAFYALLMLGLLLALLAENTVCSNVGAGSAVQVGMLLVLFAAALFICGGAVARWLAPLFLGCGVGVSGARFLSLFITLSPHCRRGTAQSTFFLARELGLYAGVFIFSAMSPFEGNGMTARLALLLSLVSFVMFFVFTNKWYLRHKNR